MHNHLIGTEPTVMFMPISGMGESVELARKFQAVLDRTGVPLAKAEDEARAKRDCSEVQPVLGSEGEIEGG